MNEILSWTGVACGAVALLSFALQELTLEIAARVILRLGTPEEVAAFLEHYGLRARLAVKVEEIMSRRRWAARRLAGEGRRDG